MKNGSQAPRYRSKQNLFWTKTEFVYLFFCQSTCLFTVVCQSTCLFTVVCQHACLSVCLFVCLSACLLVCLSLTLNLFSLPFSSFVSNQRQHQALLNPIQPNSIQFNSLLFPPVTSPLRGIQEKRNSVSGCSKMDSRSCLVLPQNTFV